MLRSGVTSVLQVRRLKSSFQPCDLNWNLLRSSSTSTEGIRKRPRRRTRNRSTNNVTSSVGMKEDGGGNGIAASVPGPKLGLSSTDKDLSLDRPREIESDPIPFRRKADEYLTFLHERLLPMQSLNDVFHLSRKENGLEIQLRKDLGTFVINANDADCVLDLTSPKSGGFTYVMCRETGRWRCKEDGHDLNGMIVRDLIQLCNGLPNL